MANDNDDNGDMGDDKDGTDQRFSRPEYLGDRWPSRTLQCVRVCVEIGEEDLLEKFAAGPWCCNRFLFY